MALSGKTTNFELKYPALVDDIVMGESGNDFKEMMDSVDIALRDSIFKTVESGTDLNTLTTGLYQLGMPMVNDPSPTVGPRYLIAASDSPGSAQYYFAGDGKIYYRFNTRGSFTTTDEWKEVVTEDITGKLTNLTEGIVNTNLVAAINSIKDSINNTNGIKELSCAALDDESWNIDEPGYYLMIHSISGEKIPFIVEGQGTGLGLRQFRIRSEGIETRFKTQTNTWEKWEKIATEDIVGDLTDLTTTTKTNLVSAVNELKTNILDGGIVDLGLVEGDLMDDMVGIDSSFLDVTTAGIYKFSIKNNGNETVDGYLIVSNNTTVTDEFDQWLFVGGSLLHRVSSAGGLGDWNGYVTTDTAGRYSKKYSTIVIGNSGSGHTADEVDYLYEAGSDFGTILTSAINKLASSGAKGGEIKILSGTYTLASAVTTSGTAPAPIKITGEGKSTIITSPIPRRYDITASYCEISECRLDTDIRITTSGYVNIHDCEIAERIYISNMSALFDIFIHDNNLDYTTAGKDFLYLSESGGIYNFQVYNNYSYGTSSFDFLYVATTKPIYNSSIRNNHCPYSTWDSSNYSLNASGNNYFKNIMTGNTFYTINFSGSQWGISNNHIVGKLYLYDGDYLDVMNNRVDGTFTAASGLTYANITGNVIDTMATSLPYVNLGTNARFVNNVIRDTNFNTTYLPGHDITSNKWGNNMWADGIDRLVFANGEGIGEGQGDA